MFQSFSICISFYRIIYIMYFIGFSSGSYSFRWKNFGFAQIAPKSTNTLID